MSHYLPPTLMAYFQPRPPLPYLPPPDYKRTALPPILGIASYIDRFVDYSKTVPLPLIGKTSVEKRADRHIKQLAEHEIRIKKRKLKWNPKVDKEGQTVDAYKTLFVGRLAYALTEKDIEKEFEYYGPIANVHLVKDKNGNSRGYCFVEFTSSKDLSSAFKDADGRKIAGRRIVVDVERGRTVKNWLPRRLGGGLGGTRLGAVSVNKIWTGRDEGERDTIKEKEREREEGKSGKERVRDKERDAKRERDRIERERLEKEREAAVRSNNYHQTSNSNNPTTNLPQPTSRFTPAIRDSYEGRGREREKDRSFETRKINPTLANRRSNRHSSSRSRSRSRSISRSPSSSRSRSRSPPRR